jgi:plasmid stabilization system protein ParE
MRRVRFYPDAELELTDALQWYARKKAGLDAEFMHCIEEALSRIVQNPFLFPLSLNKTRKTLVRKFPYIIYYAVGAEEIMIVAVFHTKRDPKHWQRRE